MMVIAMMMPAITQATAIHNPPQMTQTMFKSSDSGDIGWPSRKRVKSPLQQMGCYCASARMPPANECHHDDMLIGRFSNFSATSAIPPYT